MPTYTVVAGDSWERIAGKVYGDQRMWAVLREANNAILLQPGRTISLPGQQRDPYVSAGLQAAKQAGTTGLQGVSQFDADTLGRVTSPATDLARILAEPGDHETQRLLQAGAYGAVRRAPGYTTPRVRFDTETPPDVRRAQERARLTQALGLVPRTASVLATAPQSPRRSMPAGGPPSPADVRRPSASEVFDAAVGVLQKGGAAAAQANAMLRFTLHAQAAGSYEGYRRMFQMIEAPGAEAARLATYRRGLESIIAEGVQGERFFTETPQPTPGDQPLDAGRYGQWVIRGSEGDVYSGQSPQARLADAARYTGQGVSAYLDAVATGVNPWTGETVSEDAARQWLPTVMSGPMMSTMMGLKSTNPWGITDTVQYAYAMGYDWDPTAWGGGAFIIAGPRRAAPIVPSGSKQARAGGGGGAAASRAVGGGGVSPWNWSIRIT